MPLRGRVGGLPASPATNAAPCNASSSSALTPAGGSLACAGVMVAFVVWHAYVALAGAGWETNVVENPSSPQSLYRPLALQCLAKPAPRLHILPFRSLTHSRRAHRRCHCRVCPSLFVDVTALESACTFPRTQTDTTRIVVWHRASVQSPGPQRFDLLLPRYTRGPFHCSFPRRYCLVFPFPAAILRPSVATSRFILSTLRPPRQPHTQSLTSSRGLPSLSCTHRSHSRRLPLDSARLLEDALRHTDSKPAASTSGKTKGLDPQNNTINRNPTAHPRRHDNVFTPLPQCV
jgi:hypothetical protein